MSMRPWVGYTVMGKRLWSWTWRMAWGMGMHGMGGWLWAWACVGRGASAWVVGVPWLWQGEGASGVPIQRNLLNVYPHLEL